MMHSNTVLQPGDVSEGSNSNEMLEEDSVCAINTRTLFQNKVYEPWYSRYREVLPDDQRLELQPVREVEQREIELALRYWYGSKSVLNDKDEFTKHRMRRVAVTRYQMYKKKEEQRKITSRFLSLWEEGPTASMTAVPTVSQIIAKRIEQTPISRLPTGKMTRQELVVCGGIVEFMIKLMNKTRRQNMQLARYLDEGFSIRNSNWIRLRKAKVREKISQMYKDYYVDKVRTRFNKVIKGVYWLVRFFHVCSEIAGSTTVMLRDLKVIQDKQDQLKTKKGMQADGKFIFDSSKFVISGETSLENDVLFTLTKMYYNRTEDDVKKTIKSLQVLRCFAELPVSTQRFIASVAWYIKIPENKMVIRQCHEAKNCYILLSGKVFKTELMGTPDLHEDSSGETHGYKLVQSYLKDSIFGVEALTKPGSLRDYSVMTGGVKCEALSISVHDYFNFSMIPPDERTLAPDHIKFISNCNFLKDFPCMKLIEDAEDNIFIAYFNAGTVVEQSMDMSQWIYVVKHGTCRAIVELKPDEATIARYGFRQSVLARRHGERKCSQPLMTDRMTPQTEIATIEEERKKQEEEERRRNRRAAHLKLVPSDSPAGVVDAEVTRILAEMSQSGTVHDQNILEEIEELKYKTKILNKRLAKIRAKKQREERTTILPEINRDHGRFSIVSNSNQQVQTPRGILRSQVSFNTPVVVSHESDSDTALEESISQESQDRATQDGEPRKKNRSISFCVYDDQDDPDREIGPSTSRAFSSMLTLPASLKSSLAGSGSIEPDVQAEADINNPDARPSESLTATKLKSLKIDESRTDSFDGGVSKKASWSGGRRHSTRSSMHRPSSLSESGRRKSSMGGDLERRRSTIEARRDSIAEDTEIILKSGNLSNEDQRTGRHYSRWKLIKTLVKGDDIGSEWVNLHNGNYRPPDDDPSFVSDGAELVLVRKEFIIKHLSAVRRISQSVYLSDTQSQNTRQQTAALSTRRSSTAHVTPRTSI